MLSEYKIPARHIICVHLVLFCVTACPANTDVFNFTSMVCVVSSVQVQYRNLKGPDFPIEWKCKVHAMLCIYM